MWDLIKNDPILKSISILIVGIFSFAFAFSIMFGASNQSGMEHGASQSGAQHASNAAGYSAATGLGEIIILLSKLLIIILLVAIIILAVKFIQKHVIGKEPIKGIDYLKSKPFMTILVGTGGILLLILAMNMLVPASNGNEMVQTTMQNNSVGYGLTGILAQLLKLIAVVSFIGLVIGLVMYFKDRYIGTVNAITIGSKEQCTTCGTVLKASWKCCPSCGNEKNKNEVAEIIAEDNGKN